MSHACGAIMQPIDKFGNTIYPKIYHDLEKIGKLLHSVGYIESGKEPNLFYFKGRTLTFFADMRGTAEVPIFTEPAPLVYWRPHSNDVSERNQISEIIEHVEILAINGIPKRISFYMSSEPGSLIFENDNMFRARLKSYGIPDFIYLDFFGQNGHCYNCNKFFQNVGFFCSDECRKTYIKKEIVNLLNQNKRFCEVCGTRIIQAELSSAALEYLGVKGKDRFVIHHISYYPERVMVVCPECHSKIHHSDIYPKLKPPLGESKRFYGEQKGKSGV